MGALKTIITPDSAPREKYMFELEALGYDVRSYPFPTIETISNLIGNYTIGHSRGIYTAFSPLLESFFSEERRPVDAACLLLIELSRKGLIHFQNFQLNSTELTHLSLLGYKDTEGFEAGDVCGRNKCIGVIKATEKEPCYCHTGIAPCGSCCRNYEYCPECGWEPEQP